MALLWLMSRLSSSTESCFWSIYMAAAHTEDLPRMTQGANISPGFGGRVYFVGVDGVLYEITGQVE